MNRKTIRMEINREPNVTEYELYFEVKAVQYIQSM